MNTTEPVSNKSLLEHWSRPYSHPVQQAGDRSEQEGPSVLEQGQMRSKCRVAAWQFDHLNRKSCFLAEKSHDLPVMVISPEAA